MYIFFSMTKNMNYNETTDFVIPLHRYHYMVRTVVEAFHNLYSPRIIYIITPKRYCALIMKVSENWTVKKLVVLPEETFFMSNYKLQYNDIFKMFNNIPDERSREFGWWYQQIIKLGAFNQIPNLSDPYIVWDSDLIPIVKWEIYPTSNDPYFKFAILQEKARSEWNMEQYKHSLVHLTKYQICDPEEGTFVPHHFVFYHDVLIDLINHIEFISNKTWIDTIIGLSHNFFRFSEYRTVASFMNKNYLHLLKYHEYKNFGKFGKRIRDSKSFLLEMNNYFGELHEISYYDFIKFSKYKYNNLPCYLQIEHI